MTRERSSRRLSSAFEFVCLGAALALVAILTAPVEAQVGGAGGGQVGGAGGGQVGGAGGGQVGGAGGGQVGGAGGGQVGGAGGGQVGGAGGGQTGQPLFLSGSQLITRYDLATPSERATMEKVQQLLRLLNGALR